MEDQRSEKYSCLQGYLDIVRTRLQRSESIYLTTGFRSKSLYY